MFANGTVPDYNLDDPRQDEEMTPEQLLDDGDEDAWEAFFQHMMSPEMNDEMFDIITSLADSVVMRANIKRWSEKVQRGEL